MLLYNPPMQKLRVVIVSPALADANNGNWQTARRWQGLLRPHAARIVKDWPDALAGQDDLMLALHARRSAPALAAWHAQRGARGLGLVLTGTDLYRDLAQNASAQRSLQLAAQLAVLNPLGLQALPRQHQGKARVILPSTSSLQTLPKTGRHLRAVMVGHLRDEKDPLTLMAAARLLDAGSGVFIDHIGGALDASLGQAARTTQAQCPHYRWLGPRTHADTRRRIQRAHVLVHTSRIEGGAHVLMEALCSGTPVLASRIDGNLGLLGQDYAGCFDVGDAQALAGLLRACRADPALLARLQAQCAVRAPLFDPAAEGAALHRWVQDLWNA